MRYVSLREFGPYLYHPVGGEKLADCLLIDPANGLYRRGDQMLEPIIRQDEEGFITISHWKRDPKTGHKWRQPYPPQHRKFDPFTDELI